MATKQKNEWVIVDWDGNPDLHLKCWRKKFGRGHVSVGVGDFLTVCYSYGANSDDSIGSTRWHYDTVISEKDMMDFVDANQGKCKSYPCQPGEYREWFNKRSLEVQHALLSVGKPWERAEKERHLEKMAI